MSLNGLDAPTTQEAYQYAVAESGGWMLLKYVNRDSVEVHERGKGGVNEARLAVGRYEEQSPLYGIIIYRRRKVLLKYVPERTSRLLQARTAVHFQDVMEKYAPYETILEFTTSEGLSDTALAAVFPLHTASPAVSSSRLNEISEDAEDGGAPGTAQPSTRPPPSIKSSRERRAERVERAKRNDRPRVTKTTSSPPPSIEVNGDTSPNLSPLASPKSTISQFLVREESGHRSITSLTAPSIASVTEYGGSDRSDATTEPESAPPSKPDLINPLPREESSPQPSSGLQSDDMPAPSQASPTEESGEQTPSARVREKSPPPADTRRPSAFRDQERTAAAPSSPAQSLRARNEAASQTSRSKPDDDDPYDLKKYDYLFEKKPKLGPRLVSPETKSTKTSVAAIPSNVRPRPPKKDPQPRPKSHGPGSIPASQLANLPAPPPVPDMPEYTPRPLSRGSVKSLPSHKSTAMTPDKLRLMKAIELRKKQMRKSQGAEMIGAPKFDADVPAVPAVPATPEQAPPTEEPQQPEQASTVLPEAKPEEETSKKADSGIELEYHDPNRREDKQTLALLESPRQEDFIAPQVRQMPEVRQPTRATDDNAEPTPRAYPVTVADMPSGDRHDDHERQADQLDSDNSDTDSLSPKLGRVPTLVEPQKQETDEPSLDERQVFGDEPLWKQQASAGTLEEPQRSPKRQNSDLAKRRRGYIEPIHLDDMSSDDEFAEELRSATLHEAKPVTVAKSPITESFIRRPSYGASIASTTSEAVTGSPRRRSGIATARQSDIPDMPSLPVHESIDTSPTAERHDPMANLKRNVSSGISRRIQALADHSSRDPSPHDYNAQSQAYSPETAAERPPQSRSSLRPPRSRTSSFQKTARLSARFNASQQPQLGGMYQAENQPVVNVHHDPTTNRGSVSVTARIVRPQTNEETMPYPDQQDAPPTLNENDTTPTEKAAQLARLDTSSAPAMLRPESKSTSPDLTTRTMHSSTRNHFGRHRQNASSPATPLSPLSPHPDDFPAPPAGSAASAPRTQSSTSLASNNDDNATPREGTRTSRFFKRMSNIATKRRSTAQGSIAGDSINSNGDQTNAKPKSAAASRDGEKAAEMPPAVALGNLNVQFPDSLLWKRRIVTLDEHGNICFAIPQAMDHQRGSSKRFPLSEFRTMPYVPDLDRQELPCSVVLDFADGTTLQVACEDAATHRRTVGVLRGYWRGWSGVG